MYKKPFFFRDERQLKKINLDEIIYLEASKNYTRLYTGEDTFLTARITLLEAMKLLPENKFIRVHRSYIVAADHIESVRRESLMLVNLEDVEIPVSRMYYATFTKQFIILDSGDIEKAKRGVVKKRKRRDKY